jgi:opacity protein-like surface antigen
LRKLPHRSTWKTAILLGILWAVTRAVSAQAIVTAERGIGIAPFAQATLLRPDWGQTNNLGYTAGLDYTRFIRSSILQPSLEFRYTRANGATVNERSYSAGIRLQTTVHGVHPYATFLAGHGNIDFNYANGSYYGDNSIIYSLGAGAELNVTPLWKLRLDFTSQHWNIIPQTLTPMTFAAGVAYSLPFRNRRVQ